MQNQCKRANQWLEGYHRRDELQALLIDSDARDALIEQAYRDVANGSYQLSQRPVLCKALARLYNHTAFNPLRANVHWSDDDWRVARWYCRNCYPFESAGGSSTVWAERPLVPKKWVDNVVRSLGPVYDYMSECCADAFLDAPPRSVDTLRRDRLASCGDDRAAQLLAQRRAVAEARAQGYSPTEAQLVADDQRVYNDAVAAHRRNSAKKQVSMSAMLDTR